MTTPNEEGIAPGNDLLQRRIDNAGPAIRAGAAKIAEGTQILGPLRNLYESIGFPESPAATVISTILGMVAGSICRLSGLDVVLAKRRAFAMLEAACDRHRAELVGKGYLFRLSPDHHVSMWGDGADVDQVDTLARILRAMTMEVCDLLKNDAAGISVVHAHLRVSIDILSTMG